MSQYVPLYTVTFWQAVFDNHEVRNIRRTQAIKIANMLLIAAGCEVRVPQNALYAHRDRKPSDRWAFETPHWSLIVERQSPTQ